MTIHSSINAPLHQQSAGSAEEKSVVGSLQLCCKRAAELSSHARSVRKSVTFPMSGAAPSNSALKLVNGREVARG